MLRTLVWTKGLRLRTHPNLVYQRWIYNEQVRMNDENLNCCWQFLHFFSHSTRSIGGARPTDGTGCPRCGFVVFEAEKMISKGSSWHKRCFNCADCHRSLDSTNLCDAPNAEIYWWDLIISAIAGQFPNFWIFFSRGCYGRTFGPRGVGFGLGAGVLSTV